MAAGQNIWNLPFYKAMAFTLFYTCDLPFVIVLGLVVALAVDNMWRPPRGPTIFASLLPFIVTLFVILAVFDDGQLGWGALQPGQLAGVLG